MFGYLEVLVIIGLVVKFLFRYNWLSLGFFWWWCRFLGYGLKTDIQLTSTTTTKTANKYYPINKSTNLTIDILRKLFSYSDITTKPKKSWSKWTWTRFNLSTHLFARCKRILWPKSQKWSINVSDPHWLWPVNGNKGPPSAVQCSTVQCSAV